MVVKWARSIETEVDTEGDTDLWKQHAAMLFRVLTSNRTSNRCVYVYMQVVSLCGETWRDRSREMVKSEWPTAR